MFLARRTNAQTKLHPQMPRPRLHRLRPHTQMSRPRLRTYWAPTRAAHTNARTQVARTDAQTQAACPDPGCTHKCPDPGCTGPGCTHKCPDPGCAHLCPNLGRNCLRRLVVHFGEGHMGGEFATKPGTEFSSGFRVLNFLVRKPWRLQQAA